MADNIDETHAKLIRFYDDYLDSAIDNNRKAHQDRDYYDGIQWSGEDLDELERRCQPAIVKNRIKPKVNFLIGAEIKARTDPKAFARTPGHDEDAEAITDALRFVVDKVDYDQIRTEVAEDQFIEGIGGAEVIGKKKKGTTEVEVNHIPFDRYFYDPHSMRADFKDKRYDGQVVWMDKSAAKIMYPGKEHEIDSTSNTNPVTLQQDDKPERTWLSSDRKRIKVIQIYWIEKGVWKTAHLTRGGWLIDPQDSPYLDEDEKPENPIETVSGYIDRDNNRYGVVRDMISPQDQINKTSSKAQHLMNVRQVRVDPSFFNGDVDIEEIREQMAKPDGVVVAGAGGIEILQTGDMAQANLLMLQEAKAEIDQQGPNASNIGKDPRQLSGKAILAQQQGGLVETTPLTDKRRNWDRRIYRQIWHRIRQYWDEERWIRVTDDETNIRWVGINRKVTRQEAIEEQIEQMEDGEDKQVAIAALQEMQQTTPAQLQEVIEVRNQVSEMDVDIILEDAPDVTNIAFEEFENLATMAQNGIDVPVEMIVEASSLRRSKKDKIIEGLEQPNPFANKAAELSLAEKAAEIQETQSKTALNEASAENKQVDSRVKAAGAGAANL